MNQVNNRGDTNTSTLILVEKGIDKDEDHDTRQAFFSTIFLFCAMLVVAGCQESGNKSYPSVKIAVPEAISARNSGEPGGEGVHVLSEPNEITARVEIPQLDISTPLSVNGDRAEGNGPELPPGRYLVRIIFETQLSESDSVTLAEAQKEVEIAAGSNFLVFYEADYEYPDDDGDGYNNLTEIRWKSDPRNSNVAPQPARVFVTSVSGTANLSSWPDAGGKTGLAAGDAICQARADAAGLEGRFVAWLSDRNHDAYCRVHGLDGKVAENCNRPILPKDAGPWVRNDGFPFSPGITELTRESVIYAPLMFGAFGDVKGEMGRLPRIIWTGTDETGTWAQGIFREIPKLEQEWGDCNGWNLDGAELMPVAYGYSQATHRGWTIFIEGRRCNETASLACFEVGEKAPLPEFREEGKRVFITSVTGPGDLSSWQDAAGKTGILAGDSICQARARQAGLPNAGSFKAFLADNAIGAADRLVSNGPWVRLDGVPVARSKQDLIVRPSERGFEGGIFTSISVNETGEYVNTYITLVWTGTDFSLEHSSNNCLDWTSSDEERTGTITVHNYSNMGWLPPDSESAAAACNLSAALYCFEDE